MWALQLGRPKGTVDMAPEASTPASYFLREETRDLSTALGVVPALRSRGGQMEGTTSLKCALPGATYQDAPPLKRES